MFPVQQTATVYLQVLEFIDVIDPGLIGLWCDVFSFNKVVVFDPGEIDAYLNGEQRRAVVAPVDLEQFVEVVPLVKFIFDAAVTLIPDCIQEFFGVRP